jgi:hypothetical protein
LSQITSPKDVLLGYLLTATLQPLDSFVHVGTLNNSLLQHQFTLYTLHAQLQSVKFSCSLCFSPRLKLAQFEVVGLDRSFSLGDNADEASGG